MGLEQVSGEVIMSSVTGNILLFYAFDIGDEIDLNLVKQKGLVPTYTAPLSAYVKNYHVPLSFRLPVQAGEKERTDCVLGKIHHFGVLSFCYKIPFHDSLDVLKQKIIDIKQSYDKQAEIDAKLVFQALGKANRKPRFYNVKNDYFAVHVNPVKGEISAEEFKELYEEKIASLLRLETKELSEYQKDDILGSILGYYGKDLIIIDSEASFIYDDEFFEAMEFIDSVNVQQLELKYFDRLLDNKLTFFYNQPHKVPWYAYIPIVGRRFELPVSQLIRLRIDISVVTERLENSIKTMGEAYYTQLYSMLLEKLALREWRDSIARKLDIIWDLYTVQQSQLTTIHDEILTLVIILLIAFEAVIAFWH